VQAVKDRLGVPVNPMNPQRYRTTLRPIEAEAEINEKPKRRLMVSELLF